FEPGRKSRAAAAALPGRLHLVDDGVTPPRQNRLGAVPGAAGARAVEAPIVQAIEIFENAIFIGEHYWRLGSVGSAIGGFGTAASWRLAASPGFFALLSCKAWAGCPDLPLPL